MVFKNIKSQKMCEEYEELQKVWIIWRASRAVKWDEHATVWKIAVAWSGVQKHEEPEKVWKIWRDSIRVKNMRSMKRSEKYQEHEALLKNMKSLKTCENYEELQKCEKYEELQKVSKYEEHETVLKIGGAWIGVQKQEEPENVWRIWRASKRLKIMRSMKRSEK